MLILLVFGCLAAIALVALANRHRHFVESGVRPRARQAHGSESAWLFTVTDGATVDCSASDSGGGCDGGGGDN
jgi:hypothetical protein